MRWLDAAANERLGVNNRGLAYGDGLFETMRVINGEIRFLDAHLARLRHGAEVLGIALAEPSAMLRELQARLADVRSADWLKLIVTRGDGARGYASHECGEAWAIVSSGRLPAARPRWRVHLCRTTLPTDPLLAGIKHLNRLPQVLARREWQGDDLDEGIMCDADGHVACGIMSNVFIVRDGQIITPRLQQCGVAGVMRGWLLQQTAVTVREVGFDELFAAEEIMLTNALRGIVSALSLDRHQLPSATPVADALRQRLLTAGP